MPWATIILGVLAAIIVAVGGVVVIVHPDTLTFAGYLDDLRTFALAVAGLGVARAIYAHAPSQTGAGPTSQLADPELDDPAYQPQPEPHEPPPGTSPGTLEQKIDELRALVAGGASS